MRLFPIVGVICLSALPVAAQEQDQVLAPGQALPQDPVLEAIEDDGLSELERLSRTEDDPFAGVLEREEREPVSVTLRALDKVTARYVDIEIPMNEIARFGSLELLPRSCDKRPPEEFPETTAFLEIFDAKSDLKTSNLKRPLIDDEPVRDDESRVADQYYEVAPAPAGPFSETGPFGEAGPLDEAAVAMQPAPEVLEGPQAEGENIFRGWMFASSPALNALEHPVYDVWVIDCKTRVASN